MAADLAAFGIQAELPDKSEIFELWEEHVPAMEMFIRCSTQWRVGMSGAVGLDYTVLFHLMDLYDIKDKRQTFEDVQVIEAAILSMISKDQ